MKKPLTSRTLPPDARIVLPSQQPQRYVRDLEYPHFSTPPSSAPPATPLANGVAREILSTILPALFIAVFMNLFLIQATQIEGYSMEPTLYDHQRLIMDKISYRIHPPERGDIVIVRVPAYKDLLVKRVIGLPGETLEVRHGVVYINGQPLDEPYVSGTPRGQYPAMKIPEGFIFVMGDNRNNSSDSRVFGPIPIDHVQGHAWVRYWPIKDFRFLP